MKLSHLYPLCFEEQKWPGLMILAAEAWLTRIWTVPRLSPLLDNFRESNRCDTQVQAHWFWRAVERGSA